MGHLKPAAPYYSTSSKDDSRALRSHALNEVLHNGGLANTRATNDLNNAVGFESVVGQFSEIASAQPYAAYLILYFIQRIGSSLAQAGRNRPKVNRSRKVEAIVLRNGFGHVCIA